MRMRIDGIVLTNLTMNDTSNITAITITTSANSSSRWK